MPDSSESAGSTPRRLCGAWRDGYGRIGTLWARALDDTEAAGTRYLYLRGASRTNLPPYGLSDLLAHARDARREIVLVEGFLDLHQLRARGIENVAALGGTSVRPQTFERRDRRLPRAIGRTDFSDEEQRAADRGRFLNRTGSTPRPSRYGVALSWP